MDARRGVGADEFPADSAGGGVSRVILRCRGAHLRCGVSRTRGGGEGGKSGVQAGDFHRAGGAGMGRAGRAWGAGDACRRCGVRPSGVVLLYLRHHRAAEGRRADAWADGIRGLQPSVRPDARQPPRTMFHSSSRRCRMVPACTPCRRWRAAPPRCCCRASGWTARKPGAWWNATASPTCSPCRPFSPC